MGRPSYVSLPTVTNNKAIKYLLQLMSSAQGVVKREGGTRCQLSRKEDAPSY